MFKTILKEINLSKMNPHVIALRLRHKLQQNSEKQDLKLAKDVVNYIENTPEYHSIKEKLPNSLLRKYKTPESMYLINKKTAKTISKTLSKHISPDCCIVEVNPGLGLLSEELLHYWNNHIYMYEISNHFAQHISVLLNGYPGRVTYKVADFFGMWKLAFKDKIDNGNRIKELLGNLSSNKEGMHSELYNLIFTSSKLPVILLLYPTGTTVKVIGSMPGLSFIKHLLNNIIFHNTNNQLGRPDLFITMPGHHYEFLTDSQIQFSKHKSIPALFQLFFDYKILTSVPKVHFLPWTQPTKSKRATLMDECNLYLVNITQKEKLPCPPEYLPLLWYFFKPHMFSKTTRVIPMLEQWIPGCGVWLISGQDPPETNLKLSPGSDDAQLPHMTIFTEFGDLNLKQKITVFKKFISWPEFEQCPFKVTMENNLPKFVLDLENDDKDGIGTHIDDIEHSDSEIESLYIHTC